jgi:hypothetical protein
MVAFFLLFCSCAVGPILIVSYARVEDTSTETDLSPVSQAWMSEFFRTPEERGIVIGLAVTFVFPMSAWMSSQYLPCAAFQQIASDPRLV